MLARVGAPTVPHSARSELVTPTGAAILGTLCRFERPPMRLRTVGYGAGSRTMPAPNVLRLLLGLPIGDQAGAAGAETLVMLECNIDDMNPQWYGYLFERLLEQGALDVTCTPVLMKKGRPGTVLSVLCRPETVGDLRPILFSETTTLGVREYPVLRHAAERAIHWVETSYGRIPVKVRSAAGRVTGATPEYEACRAAARAFNAPLPIVTAAAHAAAYALLGLAIDHLSVAPVTASAANQVPSMVGENNGE